MDTKSLNLKLTEIAEKRNQLSGMDYSDKQYDDLEEELHDIEDDFNETYGSYLEEALQKVHDKYCPENDVLIPTSYLANKYIETSKNKDGSPIYDVSYDEGISVESEELPGKDIKLVIVPNPTRILLMIGGDQKKEVWTVS